MTGGTRIEDSSLAKAQAEPNVVSLFDRFILGSSQFARLVGFHYDPQLIRFRIVLQSWMATAKGIDLLLVMRSSIISSRKSSKQECFNRNLLRKPARPAWRVLHPRHTRLDFAPLDSKPPTEKYRCVPSQQCCSFTSEKAEDP